MIAEYQILRWVILDVLNDSGVRLSTAEFKLINSSIDASIRESVTAFAEAQAAFRHQLIATLSHDLKNPLQSATLMLDLIESNAAPERLVEFSRKAKTYLARANEMVNALLTGGETDLKQGLRVRLAHFDLFALVKDVVDRWAERGPIELHGAKVEGWWDRDLVERALENLLGNAFKYGDPHAPIGVAISVQHERVILSVHNEGKHIPREELPTIFEAYARARDAEVQAKEGWGLGLSMVRMAAECHGGSIEVDSGPGRGTTFTIDIPVDARPFANQT